MKFVAIATIGIFLISTARNTLQAATATWTGAGSDSNFSDGANWSTGTAPGALTGSTSGAATTYGSTTDNAVFTNATSNNNVTIDQLGQSIACLLIAGNAGNYTIGSNSGNTLYFYGSIIYVGAVNNLNGSSDTAFTGSNLIETIAAPMVIENRNQTYSSIGLYNVAANGTGVGSATVNVTGAISGTYYTGTANYVTLTLRGSNTNANTISGLISNSPGGLDAGLSVLGFTKTDGGTWNFTNDNNIYTGQAIINGGVLGVTSLANKGVASALGEGSAASSAGGGNAVTGSGNFYTIVFGTGTATLNYMGTGSLNTTNRPIFLYNTSAGASSIIAVANSGQTITLNGAITAANSSTASSLTLQGPGNGALNGGISSAGALSVTVNSGTWTLGGNTTYSPYQFTTSGTGVLNVLSGTTVSSTYSTVGSGSTLKGAGTVSAAVTLNSGGKLQVGADNVTTGATFTLSGGLTTTSGANLTFVLGPSLTSTVLALTAGTNSLTSGLTFTLVGTGFTGGQYNNIITGVAPGDFVSGSSEISGWTITNAGDTGTFTYNSTTDNISLGLTVPEPSTWVLLLLGAGGLLIMSRFRPRFQTSR